MIVQVDILVVAAAQVRFMVRFVDYIVNGFLVGVVHEHHVFLSGGSCHISN